MGIVAKAPEKNFRAPRLAGCQGFKSLLSLPMTIPCTIGKVELCQAEKT